jgi:hypothetical protein
VGRPSTAKQSRAGERASGMPEAPTAIGNAVTANGRWRNIALYFFISEGTKIDGHSLLGRSGLGRRLTNGLTTVFGFSVLFYWFYIRGPELADQCLGKLRTGRHVLDLDI